MKDGFIHVCFIIDESGSMDEKKNDVCGGFNKVIEEQKSIENGSCAVSVYRFASSVTKEFVGRDVNSIGKMVTKDFTFNIKGLDAYAPHIDNSEDTIGENDLTYCPFGGTAMNDGIGQAVTEIGEWLAAMPEEDRPEKNLIVIMTDGEENSSRKYTISQVKDMIKHQAEVYNWSFIYMGTDITDSSYANDIMAGVANCSMSFSSHEKVFDTYAVVNEATSTWRNMAGQSYETKCCTMNAYVQEATDQLTNEFEDEVGTKIK